MKQLTINPNNEPYYSEDFIKGFKCGTQRQLEADKADRPQGEWKPKNHHTDYCSKCGFEETQWRTTEYKFCPHCGARMI